LLCFDSPYVSLSMDKPIKIVKLPRNGPKPGQSTEAWLRGKDKNCQKERDAASWKRGV